MLSAGQWIPVSVRDAVFLRGRALSSHLAAVVPFAEEIKLPFRKLLLIRYLSFLKLIPTPGNVVSIKNRGEQASGRVLLLNTVVAPLPRFDLLLIPAQIHLPTQSSNLIRLLCL